MLYSVVCSELLQTICRRVHGGENDVLVLRSQFIVEGSDHLALAAPGRIEVHDEVLRAGQQFLEVLLVLHLHHVLAHQMLVLRALRSAAAEVLQTVVALGVDGLLAGLPVGGTHLAVLRDELEGLHQTQRLVHAAAHREVVHGDVLDHALGVDDEQAAESDAELLHVTDVRRNYVVENAILRSDLLGVVTDDWDLHVAKTTLLARSLDPGEVRLNSIAGTSDQFRVDLSELLSTITESNDLCRTHKSEILRIEEKDNILA